MPEHSFPASFVSHWSLVYEHAKAWNEELTEGVGQATDYATKLELRFTYATNGRGIYGIDMETGHEGEVSTFPTPDELWNRTFATANAWRDRFAAVPFEDGGGRFEGRYYQDLAIERALGAIADGKDRVLLTLATGTGKTFIAFQLAWKSLHSRWKLKAWRSGEEPTQRPRILFLADCNILANAPTNHAINPLHCGIDAGSAPAQGNHFIPHVFLTTSPKV